MTDTDSRPVRAASDIVAVERLAPGMVEVVTWSDSYTVDARGEGCQCPDKEYNLGQGELCKHQHAAALATADDLPTPFVVSGDLSPDPDPLPGEQMLPDFDEYKVATDGGQQIDRSGNQPAGHDQWTVWDPDRENAHHFEARGDAENRMDTAADLDIDAELFPPGESPEPLYHGEGDPETDATPTHETAADRMESDGGPETTVPGEQPVDAEVIDHAAATPDQEAGYDLPDRSVSDDPMDWVPGEFVDTIDGSQAINRKGFEVLSHFYDIDVGSEVVVPPEETGHDYCRVTATAEMPDGRTVEAHGSAHVDRGDDHYLLLEMADTRARKRALSIATGVGAVAVEELKNEVQS